MVNNSNAKRYIKDLLIEEPQTSRNLFYSIKNKIRRHPDFNEIKGICVTDPEIQYLAEPGRAKSKNGRWGLRDKIIEEWNEGYINDIEKEYLSSKALSEDLNPERRSEYSFFKSLLEIIEEY
jgi:hypothetical protein